MRSRLAVIGLGLLAIFGPCGAALAQTRWDLPTAYPTSEFHTENLLQLAADVERETAGRLKITVYANATLFKAPEIKRAVQGGQAPIGEVLLANHADEWAIFGADSVPFLADSYEAAARLYRAQRPLLERKLSEQGMMLLYSVAWPPQGIYSRKPVLSANDLKGIKWRAYTPATARMAELVGAQPVTVQAAELPQALALGMVDSYMSSAVTGVSSRSYEQLRYWYDVRAALPRNAVLVNKAAFESLDRATQDALLKAAAAAESRGWAMSRTRHDDAVQVLRKNGVTVVPPSPQLRADLQQAGRLMLNEWLQRAGPDGQALFDSYKKLP